MDTRIDRTLRDSEARFRALTELSTDWYWETDDQGRLTLVSEHLPTDLPFQPRDVLGLTPDEFAARLGIRYEQLTPGIAELAAILARRGAYRDATTMWRLPDGRELLWRFSLAPIIDDAGRFRGYRGVSRDVTRVTQDAAALELARWRLELTVQASGALLMEHDLLTDLLTIHGAPRPAPTDPPLVRSLEDLLARVHPDDVAALRHAHDQVRRCLADDVDVEYRTDWPLGTWNWRRVQARVLERAPGSNRPLRLMGASVDIDKRKRAELALIDLNNELEARIASRTEVLAEQEARLRAMMQGAPVGILVVAPDDRILEVNPRACEILGYPEAVLLTLTVPAITHPDDWPANADKANLMLSGELPRFSLEKRYVRMDGGIVWGLLTVATVNDSQGRHRYRVSVIEDITERRVARERELHHAAQISALSGRLLRAQEDERRRIARELHDDIGQTLTSVQMALGALGNQRSESSRAELLERTRSAVSDAIAGVRQQWLQLRPPVLDDLGIEAALRGLCRQHQVLNSMPVDFSARLDGRALAPMLAEAIYRICQEALNNVARHSRASRVEVRLDAPLNAMTVLTIRDNGVGFDPTLALPENHLGIVGMRERAKLLGGALRIESSPAGTLMAAEFPAEAAP